MTKILISGICGFVGATIARQLLESQAPGRLKIYGFDNYWRAGSWTNIPELRKLGVELVHADIRNPTDLEVFPECDWIVDAAANASVLAGTSQASPSRALVETNLGGTVNLLELSRRWRAGLILLSTSRVYSLPELCRIPLAIEREAFAWDSRVEGPAGVSRQGVAESFSTASPVSLYGATKVASELLALEYGAAFEFPVWINRCGVLAGAGQFARADQGIFAFWLHSWQAGRPLRYIGFGGQGHQVRDCLHPRDLARLIERQIEAGRGGGQPAMVNVSGGLESARSLRQLSLWCAARWGDRQVSAVDVSRQFDVPWLILDSSVAQRSWDWQPEYDTERILEEIAQFAEQHPDWLAMSAQ